MYRCVTDPDSGEQYGWGRVLNYVGVAWENPPDTACIGQIKIDGY